MIWLFICIWFFPLSLFLIFLFSVGKRYRKVKELRRNWKRLVELGKKRVIKGHPTVNRFQTRFFFGRPLWKETVKNAVFRYWFPIRVRLEYYGYPLWLCYSIVKNGLKCWYSWFSYEWNFLFFQWDLLKERRSFLKGICKGIKWLVVGICFVGVWFLFLNYIYPEGDKIGIFLFSEGIWVQIKGMYKAFFPFFFFFVFFLHKAVTSVCLKEVREEEVTEKFRMFDLFQAKNGFYKKVEEVSKKGEDRDDGFMYEGGRVLSEWEKKWFNQETDLSWDGWKAEWVYHWKGDFAKVQKIDFVPKGGFNLEELSWSVLFDSLGKNPEKIGNFLEGHAKKVEEKEKGWLSIDERGDGFSAWEELAESCIQGTNDDENPKEFYLWEAELDLIGGYEADYEEERDYNGFVHSGEDEDDETWVELARFFSFPKEKIEDDFLYKRGELVKRKKEADEILKWYSISTDGLFWYDSYHVELRQAEWAGRQRRGQGSLVELEWKGLQGGSWIAWSTCLEEWFDDPLELIWMERWKEIELFAEEEEEEQDESGSEVSSDLDDGVYDSGVAEAMAAADYLLLSTIVIGYLFWMEYVPMGHGTDPRFPEHQPAKWMKPSKGYKTWFYWEFLKEKRREYIDPKFKNKEVFKEPIKKWKRLEKDWDHFWNYYLPWTWYQKKKKWEKDWIELKGHISIPVPRNFRPGSPEGSETYPHTERTVLSRSFDIPGVKMKAKPVRQIVLVRRYLKKHIVKEEEDGWDPFITISLPEYDEDAFATMEGNRHQLIFPEMEKGVVAQLDWFQQNYYMEVYQVKEGVWSLVDVCYTFWGTFFRMGRFFWVSISSIFWLIVDGSSWGLGWLPEWYLLWWWPFCGKVLSVLVAPFYGIYSVTLENLKWSWMLFQGGWEFGVGWFSEATDSFLDVRWNWPEKKLDAVEWVKPFYYSLDWWDGIHWNWPKEFPRHNFILYRIWWRQLDPNFWLVMVGNSFFWMLKFVFLVFQCLVDLVGLVWNLNLWMFGTLLNGWMWLTLYGMIFFSLFQSVLFWCLMKGFVFLCFLFEWVF